VQAVEKARDAYRQQFEIGQRSLLDLLNSENELYTAKRARVNAEGDMLVAQTRVLATLQKLTPELGLTREVPIGVEAPKDWNVSSDAPTRCPVMAIEGLTAQRVIPPVAAAAAVAVPKPAVAAPSPAVAPAPAVAATRAPVPAPAPAPAPATASNDAQAVAQRVRDWAAAWSAKDFVGYQGFYADNYAPSRGGRTSWLSQRQRLVGKPGSISVDVSNLEVRSMGTDSMETLFKQKYTSSNFKDTSSKSLVWKRMNGKWVIVSESNR
jgi:adhesin transport system outer membrane protein